MAYSAINERNKNITSKRRKKNIKLRKDTLALELLLGKGERRVSRSKSRSKSET